MSAPLSLTITLDANTARAVTLIATEQQRSREQVAADAVADEIDRDVYDALYGRADYAATLDGLARRLAELARDLLALPRHDAARTIALAKAAKLPHPDPNNPVAVRLQHDLIEQTTREWLTRSVEYALRPNGRLGPITDTVIEVTLTPAGHDALDRIATAQQSTLRQAADQLLTTALHQFDPARTTD